jgi:hypoxanthine phosphoribosyltransferase
MKYTYTYLILLLIYISVFVYLIINPSLKFLFNEYFGYNLCKRPNVKCSDSLPKLRCLGFPSGHSQTITVFTLLLYGLDIISLPIVSILILIIGLQRIVYKYHTLIQVLAGIIFGLIIAIIVIWLKYAPITLIIPILIWIIITLLLLYQVEFKINRSLIPNWVDKNMVPTIYKKKNVSLVSKFFCILSAPLINSCQVYLSWNELEEEMDKLIEKVSDKKFDCVVGIKTGGAIMSSYIANKLNIPYYNIKLSNRRYNCVKTTKDSLNDILVHRFGNIGKENYIICEGISDDLTNKRILLVDEQISSGKTIIEAINYLKNELNVDTINTVVLKTSNNSFNNKKLLDKKNYISLGNENILVWPWGYEN